MLAAAAATGRSTHLYWLPCLGSMLRGMIHGYANAKFSDECSWQMDGDNALVMPWTSESQPPSGGYCDAAGDDQPTPTERKTSP
jgi:hypothetical protein